MIEGMINRPLHRKRGYDMNQQKSESTQSISYQQIGALREGEREVTHVCIFTYSIIVECN